MHKHLFRHSFFSPLMVDKWEYLGSHMMWYNLVPWESLAEPLLWDGTPKDLTRCPEKVPSQRNQRKRKER